MFAYSIGSLHFSNAATEISSSDSSQWIPTPLPMSLYFVLCSLVASRSFGNHSRGTLIFLPPKRRTCIISESNHTSDAIDSVILATLFIWPMLFRKWINGGGGFLKDRNSCYLMFDGEALQVGHKVVGGDFGLSQNTPQGPDCQFAV
jgi:hypothetical protein